MRVLNMWTHENDGVLGDPNLSTEEGIQQGPEGIQKWRIMEANRKSSVGDDYTAKTSFKAGKINVLQV